jgi:hypothetical protein
VLERRPAAKVRYCLAVRTAATSAAGRRPSPVFQPVTENVLPSEEIVRVRSAMPGQRGERHVLALEDDVLVDLVGDGDEVARPAQLRDQLQLRHGEDLARRVVGRVEQEDAPRGAGGRRERGGVELPLRWAQGHGPADRARQAMPAA